MTEPLDVQSILTKARVGQNARRRTDLAARIASKNVPFTAETVNALLRHFDRFGATTIDMVEQALWGGQWVDIVRDLNVAKEESESVSLGSSLTSVTQDNPYGWEKPLFLRGKYDHGRPGEWNAFRQCYNLTADEMKKAGVSNPRRGGSARPEVMGECKRPFLGPESRSPFTAKAPKNVYDVAEVSAAIERESVNIDPATDRRRT